MVVVEIIRRFCLILGRYIAPRNTAPWTTPAIISGFFIGGWKMAIWQACTLVISILIYFPFAKKYDQILVKQEAEKMAEEAK